MPDYTNALLQAILSVTARQTFPLDRLLEIVRPTGANKKQIDAFNLCDGSKSQTEIAKLLRLDSGNFSRTVSRWVAEGVMFRLGQGRDAKLLHVYPIPTSGLKNKGALK